MNQVKTGVNLIIVYPHEHGYAITKYGDGKLTVQPTFDKTWTKRDMHRALKNIYPKADIKFRNSPHEVVIVQQFGHAWQELRAIIK